MRIVVTTPTGHIGSKLVPILVDRGCEITVIARHPNKVQSLASDGVRVIEGEHGNADVLNRAVSDAQALFWVTPPNEASHDPIGDSRRIADEAAAVIRKHPDLHVVQISSTGAHRPDGTGPILALRETEERFRAVGKNVTSLRPNFFMENALESLPTIVGEGVIYTSVPGNIRVPQIATKDIAEIAAEQLLVHKKGHRVLDLAGPQEISFDEAASILGKTIGKPVQMKIVPGEALKEGLKQAGISEEMGELFLEMEEALADGVALEFHGDEKIRGKVTYEQFAQDVFLPAYEEAAKMAKAS